MSAGCCAVGAMRRLVLVAAVAALTVAAPTELGPPGLEAQQRLMREEPKGGEAWEHVAISPKGLHSFAELSQDASGEEESDSEATSGDGSENFAQKHGHRHLVGLQKLVESSGSNNVAEIVCPWWFNINTNQDHVIKCYDGTTCDPTANGECCCAEKGGVYQCSKTQPYMCREKECGTTHKCQASHTCSTGLRECEGPPGQPGPPGHSGVGGAHGETGKRGEIGDPGGEGHTGHEGHEGKDGPDKVASTPDSAGKAMMLGVFMLNILVALGMYFATNMQYKSMMKAGHYPHEDQSDLQPVEAGG